MASHSIRLAAGRPFVWLGARTKRRTTDRPKLLLPAGHFNLSLLPSSLVRRTFPPIERRNNEIAVRIRMRFGARSCLAQLDITGLIVVQRSSIGARAQRVASCRPVESMSRGSIRISRRGISMPPPPPTDTDLVPRSWTRNKTNTATVGPLSSCSLSWAATGIIWAPCRRLGCRPPSRRRRARRIATRHEMVSSSAGHQRPKQTNEQRNGHQQCCY